MTMNTDTLRKQARRMNALANLVDIVHDEDCDGCDIAEHIQKFADACGFEVPNLAGLLLRIPADPPQEEDDEPEEPDWKALDAVLTQAHRFLMACDDDGCMEGLAAIDMLRAAITEPDLSRAERSRELVGRMAWLGEYISRRDPSEVPESVRQRAEAINKAVGDEREF